MRAFLAVPIPEPSLTALVRLQGTLPFGRPVPEGNLHLTLAFLGQVGAEVLETLDDLISTARLPGAEVVFGGLGTFAEMERGLVFAEVRPDPALEALQAKVAQLARGAGADLPRRRFRPHVTLMRSNRQPKGPARDRLATALGQSCDIPSFHADQMNLYRSDLTPDGARHEVLAEYPLR